MDDQGYTLDYPLERPGTYVFAMEPQPYWEPAEDAFIVHYTKTYVTAYGDDEGWDTELGLKTESRAAFQALSAFGNTTCSRVS